ncbi:MAG TPA: aminotransferase class IV [Fibrobacteria bacterium]|nr:aminotransferase class IV [Fibrobacteria bacterium]
MSRLWAFVDGAYSPQEDAVVPVLDRGLLLGDGIFETVRVKRGTPEYFGEHFDRFCASAAAVRIRQPWSREALEEICAELCRRSDLADASVRITLTRGAYRGTLSDTGDPPRLLATCAGVDHIDPGILSRGVAVAVAGVPRVHELPPSIKATQYLAAVLARLDADDQGCYETLFSDRRGRVLELSSASFFAVRSGRILTPPLRLGILAGVTRSAVLRLARRARIPAREAVLRLEDLGSIEEAFLTSAVRGVVPVVRLGGANVGDGRPGPVTGRIVELFRSETGR